MATDNSSKKKSVSFLNDGGGKAPSKSTNKSSNKNIQNPIQLISNDEDESNFISNIMSVNDVEDGDALTVQKGAAKVNYLLEPLSLEIPSNLILVEGFPKRRDHKMAENDILIYCKKLVW